MTAQERNSQEGRRGDGRLHRGVALATYRGRREMLLDSHLPSRSSSCCCFYVLGKLGCAFAILHEHEDRNGGFYASPLKIRM